MPAPIAKLLKVGFNYRQASAIVANADSRTVLTQKQMIAHSFAPHQAKVLLSGTPSPDAGVTPYVPPSLDALIRQGRLTRAQATLVRATS